MSVLTKQLKLYSNSNGTTESVNIYSATSDLISGKPYMPVVVDGTTGYIQLDTVGAANATQGRVSRDSDGITYQICSIAGVASGSTTASSGKTFGITLPDRVYAVKIDITFTISNLYPRTSYAAYFTDTAGQIENFYRCEVITTTGTRTWTDYFFGVPGWSNTGFTLLLEEGGKDDQFIGAITDATVKFSWSEALNQQFFSQASTEVGQTVTYDNATNMVNTYLNTPPLGEVFVVGDFTSLYSDLAY